MASAGRDGIFGIVFPLGGPEPGPLIRGQPNIRLVQGVLVRAAVAEDGDPLGQPLAFRHLDAGKGESHLGFAPSSAGFMASPRSSR